MYQIQRIGRKLFRLLDSVYRDNKRDKLEFCKNQTARQGGPHNYSLAHMFPVLLGQGHPVQYDAREHEVS